MEAGKTREWPKLGEEDMTKTINADTRCPPGSVWRDINPGYQWKGSRSSTTTTQTRLPTPPPPPPKVMCDAGVQCMLLTDDNKDRSGIRARWADADAESGVSKPTILTSLKGKIAAKLKGDVPAPPEFAVWGPANDWAWDHDQQNDDTDAWTENDYNGITEDKNSRKPLSLPPAPKTPPPMPPQKPKGKSEEGMWTKVESSKTRAGIGSCPATPATTAGASTRSSAESSPCGGDFATDFGQHDKIKLPVSAVSCLERLQQRLAPLRKQCREAERLEQRIAQGMTLNVEQRVKAERLGSAQGIQAKIARLEARLDHATRGCEVEDSDSTDDMSFTSSSKSAPQVRDSTKAAKELRDGASEPRAAVPQQTQQAGGSNHERLQIQSQSKQSSESRQRRIPAPKAAGDAKKAPAPKYEKVVRPQKLQAAGSWFSCKRMASGLLVAAAVAVPSTVLGLFPELVPRLNIDHLLHHWHALVGADGEPKAEAEVMQLPPLMPAGSSNAWTGVRPLDSSDWGPRNVKRMMSKIEVDAARAGAEARQVNANVAIIKQKLDKERMSRRQKRQAEQQKALRAADPELQERHRQEQMQRWWAEQHRKEVQAREEWQKQAWQMQPGAQTPDARYDYMMQQQAQHEQMQASYNYMQQHYNVGQPHDPRFEHMQQ
jgi:hypothetical protein